jgi:type IV secretory pathway TrbF-like protein
MATTSLLVPITKDYSTARREFLELYGSTAVMNTYLKIALLCLAFVCLGLMVLAFKTYKTSEKVRPLIIRINEVGRVEAVTYDAFEYHPQEAEIKYFLTQFVQRYYSRIRATVKTDYARALYFLEGQLVDGVIEANKKSNEIESFLAGQGGEIDVTVKNVSIEDLRTPPYRATVDFEKVFYGAGRLEVRREKYVANFVFIVKDRVPNNFIPINPLGLTITYFREDQSFDR